jgi:OHCU decarboxylase
VITLEQLNASDAADWVTALGGIFEHSPWVAQRVFGARPYQSRLQLLSAMRTAVDQATPAEQLTLIRAHPKLGLRGRAAVALTPASTREQRRAGLAACTPAQLARLEQLNALYQDKTGFPFILAVRGHDPASIIANLERRIANDSELERRTALTQIGAIAAYRLADLVSSAPGPEVVAMLEQLAGAGQPAARTAAGALAREWMQAAGLDVCTPTGGNLSGGYLVGRTDGDGRHARTLLAGACLDPRDDTLHYQGRVAFVTAIEAAQQIRHLGIRPASGLVVLTRPEDTRLGDAHGLFDDASPGSWVEFAGFAGETAVARADGDTIAIVQALREADVGNGAEAGAMLVRCAATGGGQGGAGQGAIGKATVGAITAAVAERAVRALQTILGCAAAAA